MKIETKSTNETEKPLPPFVKYPDIPYIGEFPEILGHEGYVFEKIDGSLRQVRKTEQGVIGGSKANYLKGKRVIGRSYRFSDFLKWMYGNSSLQNLPEGIIMFGEWLDPIDVEGYDSKNLNKFYFIDLATIDENGKPVFFDYNEAREYIKGWGIEDVRILDPIDYGFFSENYLDDLVESRRSFLGNCEVEGLVLKNYRLQEFAKHLHPKHMEVRKQGQTLEEKYLTSIRVKKAIRRLKDEKDNPNPNLEELAREVVLDILEESKVKFDIAAVKRVIRANEYFL